MNQTYGSEAIKSNLDYMFKCVHLERHLRFFCNSASYKPSPGDLTTISATETTPSCQVAPALTGPKKRLGTV